jgi:hypothetical protein
MTLARRALLLLAMLLLAMLLSGCGAAAAPSPAIRPTERPTPTPVPGATLAPGSIGIGILPPGGGVLPPGGDSNLGQATFVKPQPGQQDPAPVTVQLIRTALDGRHLTVELRWWSGVAPCTLLDSVVQARDGTTIKLTPLEGSSGLAVACDAIAQLKATIVDLGELQPGTWTITASGDPAPVTVEVR